MKRIVEDLRRRGIKGYTIYKLDKPFPFYLLDSNKYNISLPYYASFFKYITMMRKKDMPRTKALVLQKREKQ